MTSLAKTHHTMNLFNCFQCDLCWTIQQSALCCCSSVLKSLIIISQDTRHYRQTCVRTVSVLVKSNADHDTSMYETQLPIIAWYSLCAGINYRWIVRKVSYQKSALLSQFRIWTSAFSKLYDSYFPTLPSPLPSSWRMDPAILL